jgi:hypothetical protein
MDTASQVIDVTNHFFQELETVGALYRVSVGLWIDSPVVPGQPVAVSLRFFTYNRQLDLGRSCVVKIFPTEDDRAKRKALSLYTVDAQGNHSPLDTLPYIPGPGTADIGDVQGWIDPPEPFSSLGKSLYAVGQHNLVLEVTAGGKDKGPYTATDLLTVIPEANASWWEWKGDGLRTAWKEEYTLAGTCTNKSAFQVHMDFTVELDETDQDGKTQTSGSGFAALDPPYSADLAFTKIKQEWPWLIQGIWIPNGDPSTIFDRIFHYIARLTVSDQYGNHYSVNSAEFLVFVSVSQKKRDLSVSAFHSAQAAISLGIASAAASAVYIVSIILGVA